MKKQKITMAVKFNTLKSIKQALIGTNIVFPAVYLLFSAEVCSGGILKNQLSSQISHTAPVSLAVKPVAQLNTIEKLERSASNIDHLEATNLGAQSEVEASVTLSEDHADHLEAANLGAQSEVEASVTLSEDHADGLEAANLGAQSEVEESVTLSEGHADGLEAANLGAQSEVEESITLSEDHADGLEAANSSAQVDTVRKSQNNFRDSTNSSTCELDKNILFNKRKKLVEDSLNQDKTNSSYQTQTGDHKP